MLATRGRVLQQSHFHPLRPSGPRPLAPRFGSSSSVLQSLGGSPSSIPDTRGASLLEPPFLWRKLMELSTCRGWDTDHAAFTVTGLAAKGSTNGEGPYQPATPPQRTAAHSRTLHTHTRAHGRSPRGELHAGRYFWLAGQVRKARKSRVALETIAAPQDTDPQQLLRSHLQARVGNREQPWVQF